MSGASWLAAVLSVLGFGAITWSLLATEVQPAVMYVDEHGNETDKYRFEHDRSWVGLAAFAGGVVLTVAGMIARRRAARR